MSRRSRYLISPAWRRRYPSAPRAQPEEAPTEWPRSGGHGEQGRRIGGGRSRPRRQRGNRGHLRGRQNLVRQALVFEHLDLLRLPILGDGEVGGLQALDRLAVLILHGDVDDYQRGGDLEMVTVFCSGALGLLLRRLRLGQRGARRLLANAASSPTSNAAGMAFFVFMARN